ncbi:uncharacterized protein C8R40DRAFT_1008990, partial [Lentinula edodes]|uniref:uncharacterized protein n=1 Tax=Lentinula edodes TaxID=5353 RepID=UPI001E8CBC11
SQTHQRRMQISSVMSDIARRTDDNEEYNCWSDILYSLDVLGVAGTSDTEEVFDTQGQQGIIKYEPGFRHPQFNVLFDTVDKVPQVATHLFRQIGRKRLPRIRGIVPVTRNPPENLPSSYYRIEYLETMK